MAEHVAVVMPAYNEAEGISGFIQEILGALEPLADELSVHVADDRSTDDTAAVAGEDDRRVEVATQPENHGHGPTAVAAYRLGLASGADIVVHVDGDGQFGGPDIARVLEALRSTGATAVHGVRHGRADPWYRRILSSSLRVWSRLLADHAVPDVNTPLRAYRREPLVDLLDALPPHPLVPHVHMSILEARWGMTVRYVAVRSLPRRGVSQTGTMWGGRSRSLSLPPRSLVRFVGRAIAEVRAARRHRTPSARTRSGT